MAVTARLGGLLRWLPSAAVGRGPGHVRRAAAAAPPAPGQPSIPLAPARHRARRQRPRAEVRAPRYAVAAGGLLRRSGVAAKRSAALRAKEASASAEAAGPEEREVLLPPSSSAVGGMACRRPGRALAVCAPPSSLRAPDAVPPRALLPRPAPRAKNHVAARSLARRPRRSSSSLAPTLPLLSLAGEGWSWRGR